MCKKFFLLLVFSISILSAKPYRWSYLDLKTKEVLKDIANEKYSLVEKKIKKLKKEYKDGKLELPIDNCLKAAYYYRIIQDYKTKTYEEEFRTSVKKAITELSKEDKDEDKIYKAKRLQYLGSAYGYRGMYRTLAGHWANAFIDGKRAKEFLENSISIDESLIDNEAGIGTFLYWRSAKSGIFKYLLFWGDKKERGISKVKKAVKDAKSTKIWAAGGLINIYMNEKKFDDALSLCKKMLKKTPDDSGLKLKKAKIMLELDKKESAIKIYKTLLKNAILKSSEIDTNNVKIFYIYKILNLSKELEIKVPKEEKIRYCKILKGTKINSSFDDVDDYKEDAYKLLKRNNFKECSKI
jgi:hypothetical protein